MLEQLHRYIWSYNASDADGAHSSWRHFLQIIVMVGRDLMDGMITLRAMSLVYTSLLSMVPLLAVSFSVLKAFGVHNNLYRLLEQALRPIGD